MFCLHVFAMYFACVCHVCIAVYVGISNMHTVMCYCSAINAWSISRLGGLDSETEICANVVTMAQIRKK